VIDALYAPTSLRLENRAPTQGPTLLVTCAPTDEQRLIVVVRTRSEVDQPWMIVGARDASTKRAVDVEETHVMSDNENRLNEMSPEDAASHIMNNDITDLLDRAEVVHERRPAKMVTALRIDLGIQAELGRGRRTPYRCVHPDAPDH